MMTLLTALSVTSWTDIKSGKIYNWTTYPAIGLAFVLSAGNSLLDLEQQIGAERFERYWHLLPIADCFLGFLLCFGLMLLCYVFFAGQVGGGDIKLIAMIGAYLGVMDGITAMLWAFVIAAMVAVIRLIWTIGAMQIIQNVYRFLIALIRSRAAIRLSDEERAPLKTSLCLSPSALVAVLVVKWKWFFELATG